MAHGQEAPFHFRQVVPPKGGFVVMAAALDRPRYEARCRVLGLKHDVIGRIQAIEVRADTYRFVRHDGEPVVVEAAGDVVQGLSEAPPDWTMRIVFELLED
ncbi:MAG: hypothetical protein AAGH15_05115 [Myxococcota bacterium]